MRILKIVLIVIVAILALSYLGTFFIASERHLERSVVINASSDDLYATLNSFKEFNEWSPWARIDPENTNYTFEGPESGVGSKMSWTSTNSDVGDGSQEIIETDASTIKVVMYFGGSDDPAYAAYIIEPEGSGTKVTWTFDGNFEGYYAYLGTMIEDFLGPSYEEGLANLKEYMEST